LACAALWQFGLGYVAAAAGQVGSGLAWAAQRLRGASPRFGLLGYVLAAAGRVQRNNNNAVLS
jgi:hypothetical protein